MTLLNDPKLEQLLDALHAESEQQNGAIDAYFRRRIEERSLSWDGFDAETTSFFADKMVALEKVKAEFCYAQCRALRARRIVECGTSFGVSTLYLAAAVRDNGGGVVVGTEWETEKARIARRNFEAGGLSRFIDLREGDLANTLADLEGPVDFVLFDIWTEALPAALSHIWPKLRPGSVLIADNTTSSRRGCENYFAFIADPKNGLKTMTLPFEGGLEFTVRV